MVKPKEQDNDNKPSTCSPRTLTAVGLTVICTTADSRSQIEQLSPASFAYIGDAVYELYIRTHYLLPPRRICAYHDQVVAQVRAETQASHLRSLSPYLTDEEKEILRRGRNAANGGPRRLSPEVYQKATSLETLIGYLYLKNPQRLNQLLGLLELNKI
ncbi:MAG: Mini-ribonuclease 3 [Moorea sp. SIO2B7]|nr:Mini-ribonuclease 3 [Moorena sp. SIO2B7]